MVSKSESGRKGHISLWLIGSNNAGTEKTIKTYSFENCYTLPEVLLLNIQKAEILIEQTPIGHEKYCGVSRKADKLQTV